MYCIDRVPDRPRLGQHCVVLDWPGPSVVGWKGKRQAHRAGREGSTKTQKNVLLVLPRTYMLAGTGRRGRHLACRPSSCVCRRSHQGCTVPWYMVCWPLLNWCVPVHVCVCVGGGCRRVRANVRMGVRVCLPFAHAVSGGGVWLPVHTYLHIKRMPNNRSWVADAHALSLPRLGTVA